MQYIFLYCSVFPFFSPNLCGKLIGQLAFFLESVMFL